MDNYGAGYSNILVVDQSGPYPPPRQMVDVATKALLGRLAGVPPMCMDCCPNLVLKDMPCTVHGWEWGMLVAHDDTCPSSEARLTAPPRGGE